MRDILFVAVGGSLGAVARYGIGIAAGKALGSGFPWGTLIVNAAGCFAMGIAIEVMRDLESHTAGFLTTAVRLRLAVWHKAIAIGFLGGLTTFSSFGADTIRELTGGRPGLAVVNVAANVCCSLIAVWCGVSLMQALD